mmetsp:Transcript_123090/g.307400  ORF Transcript_123090/g.307400 Transcript_123090/m.307400 type:complete len:240 (+) Transcript_123090:818-1537(+)
MSMVYKLTRPEMNSREDPRCAGIVLSGNFTFAPSRVTLPLSDRIMIAVRSWGDKKFKFRRAIPHQTVMSTPEIFRESIWITEGSGGTSYFSRTLRPAICLMCARRIPLALPWWRICSKPDMLCACRKKDCNCSIHSSSSVASTASISTCAEGTRRSREDVETRWRERLRKGESPAAQFAKSTAAFSLLTRPRVWLSRALAFLVCPSTRPGSWQSTWTSETASLSNCVSRSVCFQSNRMS